VPSILVADDNTNIQKMVSLAFEDRGITVVSVGNGEAAVRRIPDMNPDLVLADIFMPVRNGYEVCEFVKKDQRFAHVPVILLVGAFDPLDEKEARRVGADGVLKKPFVPPDPLIAMVISALEKNPRVVAELAKAKAAAEAPAMPDAAASFEVQNAPKPEPKPLPDFPEPTPEEAALVYGFGKGVRAIDDEELDAGKEPPAPVSGSKHDDEDDEDQGAATTSDWRRNAMDFDIPEEQANRPAFSALDELEPATFFPSEAHARKPAPTDESPAIAARETIPQFTPVVAAEEANPHVTPVMAQEVDMRALEPVDALPVESAPLSLPKEIGAEAVSIEPQSVVPKPEPELEQGHEAKPSLASRMRHWMDAIVSSPSAAGNHEEGKDKGDWVAGDSQSQPREVAPVEQESALPEPPQTTALAVVRPAEENFFAEESAPEESAADESAPVKAAPAEMDSGEVAAAEQSPISIEAASSGVETADAAPPIESDAQAPVAHASESSEAAAPKNQPEIWERVEETTSSFRDPDLDVPPAVRVTPEPLLMDEEPEPVSSYRESEHEEPAAHAFEVATSPEPIAEDAPEEQPSLPEPSFRPAAAESAAEYKDERVPTGPLPNREALAEIPFLNPPQGFDPNVHPAQSSAADASTVDAVVEKLLERLQPQLHDLLSQGVLRPLVENLLQQENAKKEK
jgi:CheY-like chemotaxis protein